MLDNILAHRDLAIRLEVIVCPADLEVDAPVLLEHDPHP